MILYPDIYLYKVTDIKIEFLRENQIKGIILDVDNTLIDYDKNFLPGLEDWCANLKKEGISFCIASNSNKKEKVEKIANILQIPYVFFATKPFKRGLLKAQNKLQVENGKIAVVGDQVFTDVLGANRCHMFSILVKPIAEKDIFFTVIKRPIENYIIKKYLKHNKGEK